MSTPLPSLWLVVFIFMAGVVDSGARDEVRLSYPSKVAAAKGKDREKLFTKWMTSDALLRQADQPEGKKQQIIYFEYKASADQWRGIFTNKVKLGMFSWWAFVNEGQMEAKLNEETKRGLVPAFITRDGPSYAMLFVSPADLPAARQELDALGVSEPKLKK